MDQPTYLILPRLLAAGPRTAAALDWPESAVIHTTLSGSVEYWTPMGERPRTDDEGDRRW